MLPKWNQNECKIGIYNNRVHRFLHKSPENGMQSMTLWHTQKEALEIHALRVLDFSNIICMKKRVRKQALKQLNPANIWSNFSIRSATQIMSVY